MDLVDRAFRSVPRVNFVPEDLRDQVDIDWALPIGFGQTISQPTTVKWMLEWLEPEPSNKVLDVGSGSGWTTALLASIVGPRGKVYAVERVPELVEFGRENVERLGIKNAKFYKASKVFGLPKHAPYDRILVSATAREVPKELLDQLSTDGKLVIPVNNDILEIEKTADGKVETQTHSGFVFVPLVKVKGSKED